MMGALANAGGNAIMALSANVRRVVTTIDSKDKAVVLLDGANPHKKVRPQAKTVSRLLWVTDQTPADLSGSADRAAIDIGIMPPRGGTVFRIVDFPPETSETSKLDPHTMHQSLGDGAPKRGLPPRHPAMHRTRTVDYAVVMAGEIDMLLDDSEIHLKAGDVLVQQGTNHAWVNRGTEPCRIAFILADAREPWPSAALRPIIRRAAPRAAPRHRGSDRDGTCARRGEASSADVRLESAIGGAGRRDHRRRSERRDRRSHLRANPRRLASEPRHPPSRSTPHPARPHSPPRKTPSPH